MKGISPEIVRDLQHASFSIVSSLDKDGRIHTSCKGIIYADETGKIYLLDLYKQRTLENLKADNTITVTVVDEHKFKGYCLKGKCRIVKAKYIRDHMVRAWEKKITERISNRILKNMKGEKGHAHYPEALLPKPEYLIVMKVHKVVDLTPHTLKQR